MGELPSGMKQKFHDLIDASNTDDMFILLQAIYEADGDQPLRITFDVTQSQMDFLLEVAEDAMKNPDLGITLRYIIDLTKAGYRQKQAADLMGTAPKIGKGQRKR